MFSRRTLAPLPVTALAALTLTACAASPVPGQAACTTADLRVTAAYGEGATQHAIYDLRFTNVSRTVCTLRGYPGVSLVTAGNPGGSAIGSPKVLIMQNTGPAKTVTLASGRRALALLGVAETVMFTGSSCNPVSVHWLKVYPPHVRHADFVAIKAFTCSSSSDQVIEISSVYPDS